jgi:hypothetical protein
VSSLQLLRIEHKLDMILFALKEQGLMIPGLPQLSELGVDQCPVCQTDIRFSIDILSESYNRDCGCKPPIPIVPGISGVMTPPTSTKKDIDHGSEPTEAPREG